MDVKLPNLGEGADSGTVVNVLVKVGDTLEKGQPMLDLENEKAVATVPATASGTITAIHVKNGDKISVGHRILTVSDGNAPSAAPVAAPQKAAPAAKAAIAQPVATSATVAEDNLDDIQAEDVQVCNAEAPASPSLRRIADELGIDLSRVKGSQSGGRVVMGDVRSYIQKLMASARRPKTVSAGAASVAAPAEQIDFGKWGEISKKPMTSLRKIISRRMVENWNAIPHVTQFDEADLTNILALRKKYVAAYEKAGARLTVTSFVLKAVIAALKKHPIFNSSMDEIAQEIVFKEYHHIGIAVDTEAGLLVPVIRDVDKKSLVQISKDLEELAGKARDRKVSPDDLKGGSFTISNQGGIGGAHFTPIVNKPEVAILGLGKGAMKPVVRNNVIEARMMLPVALSYDHRLIDGGTAARFTVDLLAAIEGFSEKDVQI